MAYVFLKETFSLIGKFGEKIDIHGFNFCEDIKNVTFPDLGE